MYFLVYSFFVLDKSFKILLIFKMEYKQPTDEELHELMKKFIKTLPQTACIIQRVNSDDPSPCHNSPREHTTACSDGSDLKTEEKQLD